MKTILSLVLFAVIAGCATKPAPESTMFDSAVGKVITSEVAICKTLDAMSAVFTEHKQHGFAAALDEYNEHKASKTCTTSKVAFMILDVLEDANIEHSDGIKAMAVVKIKIAGVGGVFYAVIHRKEVKRVKHEGLTV